jgi:CubicO group peptidase (beta-lactamase class C family)
VQTAQVTVEPEEVGVLPDRLEALLLRAQREIDEGLLPSCQIALAKDGKLVAFETFGKSTNDTRYIVFSATKPFVASAVWTLLQDGKLDLTKRVVEWVPEFAPNGKDVITLEQVMQHTSGFPTKIFPPLAWDNRPARLEHFASWTLDYEPGKHYWYHPTSAHWILAELIERVTGKDFRVFVRETVIEPLGLPSFMLGHQPDAEYDFAELVLCGEHMTPDETEALYGIRELPSTEADSENLINLNDPRGRAVGIPGGGGIGTAADLALFYQALMHNPAKIWDADFLADATGRVQNDLPDPLFKIGASRGLGVVIAGDEPHMHGFGRTNSPRAFGHGGAGGQIGWADPATGLSLGYVTNGMDLHGLRLARRGVGISSRAAICAEVP